MSQFHHFAINEKEILEQLRRGDQAGLQAIFMAYHGDLCRVAYRILRDRDFAKDIVQDVFLKIWIRRASLDIESSLSAYLKRAVVNTSINALRQHRNVVSAESDSMAESSVMKAADADETHNLNELNAMANRAIDNLPARTRAVFQLIRLEGMSYREVSRHLDISEKAVEKEMMKALRLLREALKDYLVVLLFLKIFI
jgi:RNA polymerase sigma-70 factor, ECF subfamily